MPNQRRRLEYVPQDCVAPRGDTGESATQRPLQQGSWAFVHI